VVSPGGQRAGGRVLARRYHLQRVLGRGAMGAVWEAEDTFLRRTVAVKEVVLPGSLSPEERAVSCERTLREARAIARLGHPNVVTLFDVLDEDSRPWVVMELVPSRSLAEVIKEDGPLHPLRVATVGLAILGALEAAHAASITHRDVKPGNILLGHDGRVKLTDFGIARAAGDDTITGTGLLVGSPSYIAPEIVKGLEAGAPADMWGLGATLYAAVEGRAPFSGGDAMETLSKVVQEPPTPYDRAGPLVPALDAMLEKDPVKRARPVDARRALLDVLRGGAEAEAPVRPAVPAVGVAEPTPPPEAPEPAARSAAGPGLADLLVPVWRQGRSEEALAAARPAPAPASGERAGDEPAAAEPATGGRAASASATGSLATGAPPTSGPETDDPETNRPATNRPATSGAAPAGPATGGASTSSPAGGPATGGAANGGSAAAAVGGLAAAAAAGATALRRDGSEHAPEPGRADSAGQPGDTPAGPESVAGSTVGERAREVLADDADLVDPEVADPELVDMDAATRTDLGAPLEPLPTPDRPADETTVDAADQADPEADPEATVTLPSRRLAGTVPPSVPPSVPPPVPPPAAPPRAPAYGSYGGGDELGTQRIAPLPFGPPNAPQQPARAFRPQPPSSPPDYRDERSRGDRRKRGVAALLVVVVLVVAVLAGGYLLIRSLRGGSGDTTAGGSPSASASLGPATIPAGFTAYQGGGFTVGIPKDWPPKEQRDGVVDAREPGSSTRFLRLITVDSTAPALSQLTAAERQFQNDPSYGSYQRLKLEKIDYHGLDAADWEFTFTLDGVSRHVLYRGIVTSGRTFGLYLSTPAQQWTQSADVFQVAATTFRTG
jgi:eukaryotic-like serine/threonine-protein kinase